jgi:hypothetical protein
LVLEDATVISVHDSAIGEPAETSAIMEKRIKDLEVGESLIFPGTVKDHSILYEIIREPKDHYTFTIINTGDDERGSENRGKSLFSRLMGDNKDRYTHKSYSVSGSALDAKFLEKIVPSKTENKFTSVLIRELDQALLGQGKVQDGRFHKRQKRGNCSAKAPASWLKGELMRKLGPEKGEALYLQFKHSRAQNNYENLSKLRTEVPQPLLAKTYSNRTYETPPVPGQLLPKVTQERPATKQELDEAFRSLNQNVTSIFSKWDDKVKKTEKFL